MLNTIESQVLYWYYCGTNCDYPTLKLERQLTMTVRAGRGHSGRGGNCGWFPGCGRPGNGRGFANKPKEYKFHPQTGGNQS